jgi:hypothetical protein
VADAELEAELEAGVEAAAVAGGAAAGFGEPQPVAVSTPTRASMPMRFTISSGADTSQAGKSARRQMPSMGQVIRHLGMITAI